MPNSVNPDETACYKPSHFNLHYLHRYLVIVCQAEMVYVDITYLAESTQEFNDIINTWTFARFTVVFFYIFYFLPSSLHPCGDM